MINHNYLLIVFCLIAIIGCESNKINDLPSNEDPLPDSVYTTYYDNGSIKEIGHWKNGKLNGKYYEYFNDRTKKHEFTISDGEMDGRQLYYFRGKLIRIINYENGKRHGAIKSFNVDCGFLSEEGSYYNDKMEGVWNTYTQASLIKSVFYKNDSIVKIIFEDERYKQTIDSPPRLIDCDNSDRIIYFQ